MRLPAFDGEGLYLEIERPVGAGRFPVILGRYRVEVHNWAGLPGTAVALKLTFYNSGGTAGV